MTKILTPLARTALTAYFVMLTLGAAHSTDERVPALGYLTVLALVGCLLFVIGTALANVESDK